MEQKPTRKRLGAQLTYARRSKRWTLNDLGRRTANAASRLSSIENGKLNATVDALAQTGEAVGLALTFVPAERLDEVIALIGEAQPETAYPEQVQSAHEEVFIPDPSEEEAMVSPYGRP